VSTLDPERGAGVSITDVFRKHESVVARAIAGDTFLVPIEGTLASLQKLFVLNPTAAFTWERLDGVRSLQAIRVEALEQFDVSPEQAAADICDFAAALAEAGLIVRV
jgi:hypothetical protein